jgi:uncharacterized protein YcbK (DUF882 family)
MPHPEPHSFLLNILSRRRFLKLMLFSGLLGYSPKFTLAASEEIALGKRSLSLFNPHTKENFEGIYFSHGKYIASALVNINHLMRDTRRNVVKPIDVHLLDLISAISVKLKPKRPFHVISGYRSPETNNFLRSRGKGAAKNSFHLKGQAVDIRLPGHRTATLRRAAFDLKKGGVGYYPKSRFVHIDIGPVRYWRG